MDLGTALTGIVCIAICAIPYILVRTSRKKTAQQLLAPILELATTESCTLSHHEFCGNYAIGIDETKNFLFFHWKTKTESDVQCIDLARVQACVMSKTYRTIEKDRILDTLSLRFALNGESNPPVDLHFYQADISYQLSGELQSLEKWDQLINRRLDRNNSDNN